MKKQLFLLVSLAIAVSASAATADAVVQNLREQMPQAVSSRVFNVNEANKTNSFSSSLLKTTPKPVIGANKIAKKADDSDLGEMITEAPKGDVVYLERKAWGYLYYSDDLKEYETKGYATEIVFGEDDYVYFKEPFSQAYCNSYFKGKLENGLLTVQLPQIVYRQYDKDDDDVVYNYTLERLSPVKNDKGEIEKYVVSDNQVYQMTYQDGKFLPVDDDEDILGLVYDGEWMYYGEHYISFAELEDEVTEAPKTAAEEYAMLYNSGLGKFVKVAKDGDELYIQGISEGFPENWIKGTIEGNKVTFKAQYLGIYMGYFFYFVPALNNPIYYEGYGWYDYFGIADTFELIYDEATNSYSSPENQMMVINAGKDEIYYLEAYKDITFEQQADVTVAKPATPTPYSYYYNESQAVGRIKSTIPQTSVDGDLLDANKLYYRIYVDGDLFTFYPDEYTYISSEFTEIPYTFNDNWDFFYSGTTHTVYLYAEGIDTIGVQTIYKSDNGNTYYSDICTLDIESGETEITTVENTSSVANELINNTVAKTEYFDLAGRRVINPANGIFVKRITLSNGEVKTSKAVIK